MNALTLLYSGTEKWLGSVSSQPSWGFENPVMVYRSRAASTFTVRSPASLPEAAFPIPAGATVTIYDGRSYGGGSFSGGKIIFIGRLTALDGLADPAAPGVQATFSDVWWDLQHTPFQHYWQQWNGSSLATQYYSRINLFQDISAGPSGSWGYLTTLQQIEEILNYAQTNCGLNVQYGKIDPTWNQPFYPCRAISCAEGLMLCLRPIPDAVTFMDYTAAPPKLHIRQRAALAGAAGTSSDPGGPVTLPYRDGVRHQSSRIKPRPDLQASQVVIQYQSVANVGGINYVETSSDVFPPGSAGNAYAAIVVPIDLRGGSRTYVSATLIADAASPSTSAWWQKKKPELNETDDSGNQLIKDASGTLGQVTVDVSSIKVVQEDGTDITSTWAANWPNELRPGPGVAAWMFDGSGNQIVARDVTITAKVSYQRIVSNSNTNVKHKVEEHTVSCRLRLTNSAAGSITYTAVSHTEAGEPAVSGLAQNIYNSIGAPITVSGTNYGAPLAWEGTHTILEPTISNYYTPGNLLNLSGGAAAWATMNAQIYSVEYDFFRGKTIIEFGPHRHLTTEEFFQLIMQFRTRLVWDNPQVRNTGQDNAGSNVQFSSDNAKENSTEALPQQSIHTTMSAPDGSSHQWMVQHDMTTPQTIFQQVDSGGNPVSGAIQIRLKPADISGLGLTNSVAFFQKLFVCKTDSSGNIITDGSGNPIKQKAAFLCTTPE